MTNLGNENPWAHGEQVKRRAQAIKMRMADLGYQMPLTHGYEALATSCGFRNWPTMKAQLASTVGHTEVSIVHKSTILNDLSFDTNGPDDLVQRFTHPSKGEVELIYAPPGHGKTTFAHAQSLQSIQNTFVENGTLPEIIILDFGPSALGFLSLLKDALPAHRKHEVVGYKLQNGRGFSINPFDLPLGFRKPTRERRDSLLNLLVLTSLGDLRFDDRELRDYFQKLVDHLYSACSDQKRGDQLKRFDPEAHGALTQALRKIGAVFETGKTPWWHIVDWLAEKRQFRLAEIAQRFAVPTVNDFLGLLRDERLARQIGAKDFMHLQYSLQRGMELSHIIGGPTNLDRGNAKIVALDLQAVASGPWGLWASRTAFLTARMGLCRDLYLDADDYADLRAIYREYHSERVKECRSKTVQVVYDEMHRLHASQIQNDPLFRELKAEAAAAKRVGVNVRWISQLPNTFDVAIVREATSIVLMGMQRNVDEVKNTFKLADDVVAQCTTTLMGPDKQGVPFYGVKRSDGPEISGFLQLKANKAAEWAVSSAQMDTTVRERLSSVVGLRRAIKVLADRFPSQGVHYYVEGRARQRASTSSEHSYHDLIDDVIQELVFELADIASQ